ncbi:mid1-interacting protein 1-like [Anabrus simplex]|uniref:mid1-interacting protein 1-like n=1 Tax=Anabrus simplex TaxID=316456 RepID=UPI0034DCE5AA
MLTSEFVNVYSDSVKFNMDNRNCLRRIGRHDESEFSNQSIMNVMEKFVKAVNDMDETILVPCRLMDLKVGDAGDTVEVKSSKHSRKSGIRDMDLFNLYNMINSVKNELLWGQNKVPDEDEKETTLVPVPPSASISTSSGKGHVRRPSTVSMASTNSVASISDTDSETGNENDSGIEAEDPASQVPDQSEIIASNFRRHLRGLYRSLEQLTDAASYLSTRYQNDVGGAV